jgi:hypothetical protein
MKCDEVKINLPEYIDGKQDQKTAEVLKGHLDGCEECAEFYTELKSFLKFTNTFSEITPPEGMKDEFLELVKFNENPDQGKIAIIPFWVKVAAMIVVVFGTFAGGYFTGFGQKGNQQLQVELDQLKQEVLLAGLRNYSGPQKIEAVYNIKSSGQEGDELIDALVYTMNSDKNVNVRLAAISALSGMVVDNNRVKSELINSLSVQKNPLLQISLIQVLTESGVAEAKEKIELISEDEGTNQNVKEYAKNMIKTII